MCQKVWRRNKYCVYYCITITRFFDISVSWIIVQFPKSYVNLKGCVILKVVNFNVEEVICRALVSKDCWITVTWSQTICITTLLKTDIVWDYQKGNSNVSGFITVIAGLLYIFVGYNANIPTMLEFSTWNWENISI